MSRRKHRKKKFIPQSESKKKRGECKKWNQFIDQKNPIILEERVFPIYGLNNEEVRTIIGTCFPLCNGYFMIANHVVDSSYSEMKIGFLNQKAQGKIEKYNFIVMEQFPESDLAILECKEIYESEKKPKSSRWSGKKLKNYQIIRAMGYPFGYDSQNRFTTSRAFQGTKIGTNKFQMEPISAEVYELSFHCLKGLSGTCLYDEWYNIHGMIIGNLNHEIEIYEQKETVEIENRKETTVYIKTETAHIGLAVTSQNIFRLYSNYFNMTIHEYLVQEKMH